MTERSRKLQRQFSKVLKEECVEEKLAALAAKLKQIDAVGFASEVDMLQRFPDFFSSVERSYEDGEALAKLAYTNLEISSNELNEVNAKLEGLNATIATMLDALGQGLFSFGADGICSPVFSKACETLLETVPAGQSVVDVLSKDPDVREVIAALPRLLFKGEGNSAVSVDDILDLFPKSFVHSQGLSVTLQYRPILNAGGALHSVLVIATNHTEEVSAMRLGDEREQKVLMVLRIASNRNVFTQFYLAATAYFLSLEEKLSHNISIEQVRRDLHTLKGNGSIFHLQNFVHALHELETAISEGTTLEQVKQVLLPAISPVLDLLLEVKFEARTVLGDDFDQQGAMRTIPLEQLKTFAAELRNLNNSEDLTARFISSFMGEPIHKQLASFDLNLQELADRYGKNINPSELTGESFLVYTENYESLFSSFVHIARNIIAHAIEDDETRASNGKPPALTVVIDTHRFQKDGKNWFRVSFTDDGGGIDVARLRDKLKAVRDASAVDAASDSEIMQCIFEDNLSTRDAVDELSGRGAGMGAIREKANELGGTAYAESEPNIFTRIVIEVPFIWI